MSWEFRGQGMLLHCHWAEFKKGKYAKKGNVVIGYT